MAHQDREKWDSRYSKDIGQLIPSKVLEKYIDQAPSGRALARNSHQLKQLHM